LSSVLRSAIEGWRLGAPRRGHALRALAWLLMADIALRLLPYSTVRRLIPRIRAARFPSRLTAADCEAAVRRASSVLSRSSCLARAVAAACLLRRGGRASVLTIGVGLDAGAGKGPDLHAHAWLESDGTVVTGGHEIGQYETLLRDAIPAPP
jgi:hypothetical protein